MKEYTLTELIRYFEGRSRGYGRLYLEEIEDRDIEQFLIARITGLIRLRYLVDLSNYTTPDIDDPNDIFVNNRLYNITVDLDSKERTIEFQAKRGRRQFWLSSLTNNYEEKYKTFLEHAKIKSASRVEQLMIDLGKAIETQEEVEEKLKEWNFI